MSRFSTDPCNISYSGNDVIPIRFFSFRCLSILSFVKHSSLNRKVAWKFEKFHNIGAAQPFKKLVPLCDLLIKEKNYRLLSSGKKIILIIFMFFSKGPCWFDVVLSLNESFCPVLKCEITLNDNSTMWCTILTYPFLSYYFLVQLFLSASKT